MKIACHCGATIADQTDNLPDKGHLIPDQEWFPFFNGIDAVIDDVAAGRTDAEAASMKIRSILGSSHRHIYQCRQCGRLFVDDRQHQLHTFVPASEDTCREILRSRPKGTEHHHCPTCGCKSFRPTADGDVGPLYYFLGACEECGELVHCCTKCHSWVKRKHGSNVCEYCGHSYYLPTEAEEKK